MRQKDGERKKSDGGRQTELFSEFQSPSAKKPRHFLRQDIALRKKIILNLSYENLVLSSIAFIMLLVVFFSLGVEKGKKVAQRDAATAADIISRPIVEKVSVEEEASETLAPETGESEPEIAKIKDSAEVAEAEGYVKPYTLQVIAFKQKSKADREVERLKKEGYDASIITSGDWLQVCVGKYADKVEAKGDIDSLKKKYPTCYFRRIE
jgi:hypothetical protein